jgi:hypothetical protein
MILDKTVSQFTPEEKREELTVFIAVSNRSYSNAYLFFKNPRLNSDREIGEHERRANDCYGIRQEVQEVGSRR